jgi:general secretion pathway protein K
MRRGARRGAPPPHVRAQRGVAMIIALILVALATMLAAKIGFDSYVERRRTTGVLATEQALAFSMGAEAIAADALVRSLQGNPNTTLADPWAQHVPPIPITPENDPEGEPIGVLEGGLEDLQGRFNLNNLARFDPATGKQDEEVLEEFQRLLMSLKLEPAWAQKVRDWLDADDQPGIPDGAEDSVYMSLTPPSRAGNWPMVTPTELLAIPGFGPDRYRTLAPYVTALPTTLAKINICTASPYVLEMLGQNMSGEFTDSDAITTGRKAGCYPDKSTFTTILGVSAAKAGPNFGTTSEFFRLTTRVTLGTTQFTLYSLLDRGAGGKVTPVLRTFGSP